jgi:hypothetical protein
VSNIAAEGGRPLLPPEWDRLELALRRLQDENAALRVRATAAEGRIRELDGALQDVSSGTLDPIALQERLVLLEAENRDLRERLELARGRAARIAARLDFLQERT